MEAILNFDLSVFSFIEQHIWADWLNPIMVFFTHWGDSGIFWILLSLIFLITKKYRKVGFAMIGALLVMEVGNNLLLKELIARPRPFNLLTDWEGIKNMPELAAKWASEYNYPDLISRPSSWSFPSGHTSAGFAAATALTIAVKEARFAVPAYIIAAIIGFTRIYVHVHYCTDVLGGVVVGIIYGIIGFVIVNAICKAVDKKRAKKNAA